MHCIKNMTDFYCPEEKTEDTPASGYTEQASDLFHAPFDMTSRPVYPLTPPADPEHIVGFPDIIRHFPLQVRFAGRYDGRIAANASGKRLNGFSSNAGGLDHFSKLVPIMVGPDHNMASVDPVRPERRPARQKRPVWF
jgi:hypothetical protein